MTKTIFISMPVSNHQVSTAFYRALGFEQNAAFSGEDSACMVWSDEIQLMLLSHAKWRTFSDRPLPPAGSTGVMLNLSVPDRQTVDAMNAAAAAHGGQADVNPVQEHGFMYGRDLADPDGNLWGAFWMDPAAAAAQG